MAAPARQHLSAAMADGLRAWEARARRAEEEGAEAFFLGGATTTSVDPKRAMREQH